MDNNHPDQFRTARELRDRRPIDDDEPSRGFALTLIAVSVLTAVGVITFAYLNWPAK